MTNTKIICKCGAKFDEYNWDKSRRYTQCFKCYSSQSQRITQYEKKEKYADPYGSTKDFEESTLIFN